MYKLTFYVPESHLETVKNAVFEAGAGQIGNYSHCCWQIQGTGQFMPRAGSQPHTGSLNTLERLQEWRVEMVVADEHINQVIDALRNAHPFETPAFDVVKTHNDGDF